MYNYKYNEPFKLYNLNRWIVRFVSYTSTKLLLQKITLQVIPAINNLLQSSETVSLQ